MESTLRDFAFYFSSVLTRLLQYYNHITPLASPSMCEALGTLAIRGPHGMKLLHCFPIFITSKEILAMIQLRNEWEKNRNRSQFDKNSF